ncbi:MAG: response regulator [Candidatus Aminicenantes bacterium]|nr:response regulator [Candidatus Aminicenantes bacterium]
MPSPDNSPERASHSGNGWKILVVEDEAIIAMDIQSILKKIGYSGAEVVHSGEESIQKVADGRPHLVLMDIKLKGNMDGIQAAHQIFDTYGVPVVYITAYGDENTMKRANGTARFGFITKPFEESDLQTIIQGALQKAYI